MSLPWSRPTNPVKKSKSSTTSTNGSDSRPPAMSRMLTIRNEGQNAPTPSAAPKLVSVRMGQALPQYVSDGQAVCDCCGKFPVLFGYHREANMDLCVDCYTKVFQEDGEGGDGGEPAAARFLETNHLTKACQGEFVQFRPR